MSIIDNINDDASLDSCKGPLTLEEGGNPTSESSLPTENSGSEARYDCAT